MEILGAALPNVMFIVGVLAIGLGLGIELKVVSLNKEIDKTGRHCAIVGGVGPVGASVAMYLSPSLSGRGQTAKADINAASVAAPGQLATTRAPAATQAPEPTAPA